MNLNLRRHAEVEQDILDLAAWIARDSRETAFRFMQAVEATWTDLRWMPGKGSPKDLGDRRLKLARSWPVRGFPRHLIIYEVRENEVYVFAVVHGSRQYTQLLRGRRGEREGNRK